jgi:hypothetical protein
MCILAHSRWCMQVEVSFAVALDGGVTVLPTSTAVDLLFEVRHPVAGHRRAVLRRRACT